MKLKMLCILFIVLVIQMYMAQGTPADVSVTAISNTLDDVDEVGKQVNADIDKAFAVGSQLNINSANIINGGDPTSNAKAHLRLVASQTFQTISNTLDPITKIYIIVSKLFENNTALLKNPIGGIKRVLAVLKSKINSGNLLKTMITLGSKADANILANPLPGPITINALVGFAADTLPISISTQLNAVNEVSDHIDTVLTAASSLTNALAKQSTGKQRSLTVLPITSASKNAINNMSNAVNGVPPIIKTAVNSLENAAEEVQAVCDVRLKDVTSGLKSIGTECVDDSVAATNDLAVIAISNAVSCVTNEIPLLQSYHTKFVDLAAQYQSGLANNTISTSTLLETVKTSIILKLYILTLKFKVEGCIAATIIDASGIFLPLAEAAFECTT